MKSSRVFAVAIVVVSLAVTLFISPTRLNAQWVSKADELPKEDMTLVWVLGGIAVAGVIIAVVVMNNNKADTTKVDSLKSNRTGFDSSSSYLFKPGDWNPIISGLTFSNTSDGHCDDMTRTCIQRRYRWNRTNCYCFDNTL